MGLLVTVSCWSLVNCDSYEEPNEYIFSFNRDENPLNIGVVQPLSRNYIITIGDWGSDSKATNTKPIQQAVASLLKTFYFSQKEQGYNLLFIASVGDNFYYSGQTCATDQFKEFWSDIYGDELTGDITWLAIYGNHDFGDDDPYALCAWNNTKYYNEETGIPYAANQLNKDKGGCNPDNYYIPDFSYYYKISQLLNFELIGLDTNSYWCPFQIGRYV